MKNCTMNDDSLIWEMNHLELPNGGQFAISSIIVDFGMKIPSKHVKIQTNLMAQNMMNPDGTVICLCPKTGEDISLYLPSLEYWKLDSMFPRQIVFTFANTNIELVKFAAITIVII